MLHDHSAAHAPKRAQGSKPQLAWCRRHFEPCLEWLPMPHFPPAPGPPWAKQFYLYARLCFSIDGFWTFFAIWRISRYHLGSNSTSIASCFFCRAWFALSLHEDLEASSSIHASRLSLQSASTCRLQPLNWFPLPRPPLLSANSPRKIEE